MIGASSIDSLLTIDTVVYLGSDAAAPIDVSMFTYAAVSADAYYLYVPGLREGDSVLGITRVQRAIRDTLRLSVPPLARATLGVIADIAVSDSTLAILGWRELLVFRTTGDLIGAAISPALRVKLPTSFERIRVESDRIRLLRCGLHGPQSLNEITQVRSVSLSTGVLDSGLCLPNPAGIELALFAPRQLIDGGPDATFVADALRYHVIVYDSLGHAVDTLERSPPGWIDAASVGFPHTPQEELLVRNAQEGEHVSAILERLRPYAYRIGSIRLVQRLDDTTLLITFATGGKIQGGLLDGQVDVRYDIWRRVGGRWQSAATDLRECNPEKGERVASRGLMPLRYTARTTGSHVSVLSQIQPMMPLTNPELTFGDLVDATESWEGDEIPYSMVFYRLR